MNERSSGCWRLIGGAVAGSLAFVALPALATEGMWMPSEIPALATTLQRAGLAIAPDGLSDPQRAPLGAIVWLGNCSASFVSPDGLVVTNHHCVLQSLQANSTPAHNYVRDGFLAVTRKKELPAAPGSRVYVPLAISDVTAEILRDAGTLAGADRALRIEANRKQVVSGCEDAPGVRCMVRPVFDGARYIEQKFLEITDVRLVHAPPEGIGFYGGDADNWVWPRHTGDYSFYRAYVAPDGTPRPYAADNVPYHPRHHLRVAGGDLKDGAFVMIAGFPGVTMRQTSAADAEAWFGRIYPLQRRLLKAYSDLVAREAQSEGDRIAYAALKGRADNYVKKIGGQLEAAQRAGLIDEKKTDDRALDTWAKRPENRAHAQAIARCRALRAAQWRQMDAQLVNGTLDRAQLLQAARLLYRWAKEQERPAAERAPGFEARDRAEIEDRLRLIGRQYVERIDRASLDWALSEVEALPAAAQNTALVAALRRFGPDRLYAETGLADTATRLGWLDQPAARFEQSTDPFIVAAVAGYATDEDRRRAQQGFEGTLQEAAGPCRDALAAFAKESGRPFYPDANGQLRLTWGHVTGAPAADGVRWTPFTTTAGLTAKETGQFPYHSPPALLDKIAQGDWQGFASPALGTLPVNFLSDTDITNGNSGSAVLDASGNLAGLAFDGTLEGMLSDWRYDAETTRTIAVDIRYVLWLMKNVTGAGALLDEMGVDAPPPGR